MPGPRPCVGATSRTASTNARASRRARATSLGVELVVEVVDAEEVDHGELPPVAFGIGREIEQLTRAGRYAPCPTGFRQPFSLEADSTHSAHSAPTPSRDACCMSPRSNGRLGLCEQACADVNRLRRGGARAPSSRLIRLLVLRPLHLPHRVDQRAGILNADLHVRRFKMLLVEVDVERVDQAETSSCCRQGRA